jgi:class 3 adenylate cyclase
VTSALLAPNPATTIAQMAVGFADMCGFTTLSRFLDLPHLELVVASFEELCDDALGGRADVVKPVGDGVLYAMESVEDAVASALRLAAAARRQSLLPPIRVGLAFGSVLVRRGDCFGPVVNLASRLVASAPPGTVVASSPVRVHTGAAGWEWRRLPARDLKGIGCVDAWEVVTVPSHAPLRDGSGDADAWTPRAPLATSPTTSLSQSASTRATSRSA